MVCKTCVGRGAIREGGEVVPCPDCYCEMCQGVKWIHGEKGVSQCPSCIIAKRPDRRLAEAGVPTLYWHADFESYETTFPSCSNEQRMAKVMAKNFATDLTTGATGLLFHGSLGAGKTHLAIATMKARMERGFTARYHDGFSFIKMIQSTYGEREPGGLSEADVMETAIKCDVLVLDDLGAFKVTDDRAEIMASVLNTRYLEQRVTLITTNFAFDRSLIGRLEKDRETALRSPMAKETLGDRVGDRVMSRLEQMCVPVYVTGPDMRATVLRARV